jgi:hypothetical protein
MATSRSEREQLTAAAAAQGIILPSYVNPHRPLPRDPETEDGDGDEYGGEHPAAAAHAAAEERARRLMLAAASGPGGAPFLHPHMGLGGAGLHHFLGGPPPPTGATAAQLQAAAALAAAGGAHLLSPHALMLATAHQPSAASFLRARGLAGNFAAAELGGYGGMNPLLLGAQRQQPQREAPPSRESFRLHDLVGSSGTKRDREEMEHDMEETYAASTAAKLSRQYL